MKIFSMVPLYAKARFGTADEQRQRVVNHVSGWRIRNGSAMSGRMPSTAKAGGCFLTICILVGFPLGLAIGNPMRGILIGVSVGIVLAVATWLIDRARSGS